MLSSNPFCPFSHAPKTKTAQGTASVQHDKGSYRALCRRLRLLVGSRTAPLTRCITTRHRFRTLDNQRQRI